MLKWCLVTGLMCWAGMAAAQVDVAVTYLRQAHGDWVDAEAQVIKRGRQLCTVEVSILNDEGVLCARGRVLYAMRSGT